MARKTLSSFDALTFGNTATIVFRGEAPSLDGWIACVQHAKLMLTYGSMDYL